MKRHISCILAVLCIGGTCFGLKPLAEYSETPQRYEMKSEDVVFTTRDGARLAGWFIAGGDSSLQRKPTIIVAGGDAGNMGSLVWYALICRNIGNVFLFDYRGFGKSSAFDIDSMALICPEFISDLDGAVRYVKTRGDVDTMNLALYGLSMGAFLCVPVARDHPEIKAVILENAGDLTKNVIRNIKAVKKKNVHVPRSYTNACEPLNNIGQVTGPSLLFIAGEFDSTTTPSMAKNLYAHAISEKELWIVAGAKHGNAAVVATQQYCNKILDFLQSNFTAVNKKNDVSP